MFPYDDDERDNPISGKPDNDLSGIPGAHDWLWRGGPPPVARHLPAYHSDKVGVFPRVEYSGLENNGNHLSGNTAYDFRPPARQPEQPSGPAKSSRFVDQRTGKFDYWGWLDAGMANLGKGGTLFEDDTRYPEHPYEPSKPSAFLAAGAPENARMPDESSFEAGKGTGRGEFLQPVAMKAGEQAGAGSHVLKSKRPEMDNGDREPTGGGTSALTNPLDPEDDAIRGRNWTGLSPDLKERIRARLRGSRFEDMDLDSLKIHSGDRRWFQPSWAHGMSLEDHVYIDKEIQVDPHRPELGTEPFDPTNNPRHFNILLEEVIHSGQYQQGMTRGGYVMDGIRHGYTKHPAEREARGIINNPPPPPKRNLAK